MPKAPAAITSPKIKKLAQKAMKSPSMMSTAETRELGASVMAHVSPPKEVSPAAAKKTPAKTIAAKKTPAKRS
ncbi:RNA polymerase subunit sigma [Granulicella tundricola]|uniref:RNA polymerase subunit sigma n=1 Tax=Granulicella tundricola TaxID=940615 RepID=UPI0003196A56|nr:RNA polymerase subunit sigma [Granulicella tundricola]